MRTDRDEKMALYEATAKRLEQQILGLEAGKKRLVWFFVASLGLAPVAFFFHWLAAFFLLIAGASIWGVGTYLATIHIIEDRNGMEEAKSEIERLKAEV